MPEPVSIHPLLRAAAIHGSDVEVRHHLSRGAAVNGVDNRGRSALMLAAKAGHAKTCRLLLEAGADPDQTDVDGADALTLALALATSLRHTEVVQAILEHRRLRAPAADARSTEAAHTEPSDDSDDSDDSDEEECDPSGWEEEAPQMVPPSDLRPVLASAAIQDALSRHRPFSNDADWRDVEVYLPHLSSKNVYIDEVDPTTMWVWRKLVKDGLRDGSVSRGRLAEAALMDEIPPNEALHLLSFLLKDFGIRLEEFDDWIVRMEDIDNCIECPPSDYRGNALEDDAICAGIDSKFKALFCCDPSDDDGDVGEDEDGEEDSDASAIDAAIESMLDIYRRRSSDFWRVLYDLPHERRRHAAIDQSKGYVRYPSMAMGDK